jgi:hypothetical protein
MVILSHPALLVPLLPVATAGDQPVRLMAGDRTREEAAEATPRAVRVRKRPTTSRRRTEQSIFRLLTCGWLGSITRSTVNLTAAASSGVPGRAERPAWTRRARPVGPANPLSGIVSPEPRITPEEPEPHCVDDTPPGSARARGVERPAAGREGRGGGLGAEAAAAGHGAG